MPELISSKEVKARKEHRCELCNGFIKKDEVYIKQTCKFSGYIYNFVEHKECSQILSSLWRFIDPIEGATDEDYTEGVMSYSQLFVCPRCDKWDSEIEECKDDMTPYSDCRAKIIDRLSKYQIKFNRIKFAWEEIEGESHD